MNWKGENRSFIVGSIVKNNEFGTGTQKSFLVHFVWVGVFVTNFRAHGTTLNRKSPDRLRTTKNPKNVTVKRFSSIISTTFDKNRRAPFRRFVKVFFTYYFWNKGILYSLPLLLLITHYTMSDHFGATTSGQFVLYIKSTYLFFRFIEVII